MSIVKINGRTTSSEEEFKSNIQSMNSMIYIDGDKPTLEEFSVEIHLGEGWNDKYSQNDTGLIKIDSEIDLQGHGSIVVEIAEEIRIPYNRYGIVLPTGSMFLAKGILIAAAKVEPAFIGKLKVRLYNTTSKHAKLHKGDKIGSIIFFTTETSNPLKEIYKISEVSTKVISNKASFFRWVSLNKTQFTTIAISIFALLASILNIALTHSDKIFPHKESIPQNSSGQKSSDTESKTKINQ